MTQVQISKPAKTAPKAKPAAKTAPKAKTPKQAPAPMVEVAAHEAVKFHPVEGARPGSGLPLFTYTLAWMQAMGMIDGASAPVYKVQALAGKKMIDHHTNKTGLMQLTGAGYGLTSAGVQWFTGATDGKRRGIKPADRQAWEAMLTTGQIDGAIIKNPACLKAIG